MEVGGAPTGTRGERTWDECDASADGGTAKGHDPARAAARNSGGGPGREGDVEGPDREHLEPVVRRRRCAAATNIT